MCTLRTDGAGTPRCDCRSDTATSVWTTVTKYKKEDQRDESGTQAHSRSDKMHDIDGSDVRDAGLAEQAEKTEKRKCATYEGNIRPAKHSGDAHTKVVSACRIRA